MVTDSALAPSASELARRYAAKEQSPVDAVEEALGKIGRCDQTHRAVYVVDRDRALADAAESAARWERGEQRGPLDGVPFTAKENQPRVGLPQSSGTAGRNPVIADRDAPPVQRLREAGAIYVASTTMPDLSGFGSGVSSRHGVARNAWDPTWNSGGSSSGAAVAAALGYAPLNIGTDLGGSIRVPAAFNAIVGFKPTYGRVPVLDSYTGRVAGPMTRTVDDAIAAMAVLAQPDARDWAALPHHDIDWFSPAEPIETLRVGVSLEPIDGLRASAEVEGIVQRAVDLFTSAGVAVETVDPYLTRRQARTWVTMFSAHLWVQLNDASLIDNLDAVNPSVVAAVSAIGQLSSLELMRNMDGVLDLAATTTHALESYDVVLSPVSWMTTGAADSLMTELAEGPAFTPQHNASGAPAVSINAGFTSEGKPVGLQISGRRGDDARVLRVAKWFEAHRPTDAHPDWARLDGR